MLLGKNVSITLKSAHLPGPYFFGSLINTSTYGSHPRPPPDYALSPDVISAPVRLIPDFDPGAFMWLWGNYGRHQIVSIAIARRQRFPRLRLIKTLHQRRHWTAGEEWNLQLKVIEDPRHLAVRPPPPLSLTLLL